jgi:dolichol-phosphate mannosyltransferase
MISIIIPTKDEPGIGSLVRRIHRELRTSHEIIVVDKSRRGAPVGLTGAKVLRQESDGLGNAVKEGLPHAKGSIVVIMDGDGSHRPEDLGALVAALRQSDIAIGSRFVEGGRTLDTARRKVVSFVTRRSASFILGLPVEDSMSGFAAVRKKVFKGMTLNPLGYKIVLEVAYKASKKGLAVSEVPITFLKRKSGESKVKSLSGVAELLRVVRLVIELRLGLR